MGGRTKIRRACAPIEAGARPSRPVKTFAPRPFRGGARVFLDAPAQEAVRTGYILPGGGLSGYFGLQTINPPELRAILSQTPSQPLHSRRFEATVALSP